MVPIIIRDKSECLLSIGLILLIPITIGFMPVWYDWFSKDENGIFLKRVFNILDGRWLINLPICVILSCFTIRWCYKILKDRCLRPYRPVLSVLGIIVLFSDSRFDYAKIVGHYDFRLFFTILLVAPLIVSLSKLIRLLKVWVQKRCLEKNTQIIPNNYQFKGFSDDNISTNVVSDSLKKYANEIVTKLLNTNLKEQSFALGVTGEWGVGKTTFLSELKRLATGRADVIEFNTWMCSSPEQVTNDFFATLIHHLSPQYSLLSNHIKKYAKYVGNLSLSSHIGVSFNFLLPVRQESLFERKKFLSSQFAKLPRPVVVIIDDIDRLESDEVFEVLRLIRNTADLSNMVYMVAYDKGYVTCVLEDKNIKNSTAFLEKIFPLEAHLPKVEEHLIWDALYSEINVQSCFNFNFANKLFLKFRSDEKELILSILDNYRRVKRFARLFMLNMSYLNNNSRGEVKILDVFWLELLQMYDKKVYDVLANDYSIMLYRDNDRFKVKSGVLRPVQEKDDHKYEGKLFWKDETPKILEKLFGEYFRNIKQSICYVENYDKYFTLRVSSFRLSIREMNELLNTDEEPYTIVKKWIDDGKYFNSILFQLKKISVKELDEKQLKTYIQGLLCFAMLITPYKNNLSWEVKQILMKENYSNVLKTKVHAIFVDWVEKAITKVNSKELMYLGRLLNGLYITICYDECGMTETIHELVISNEEIVCLLIKVMETFLHVNPSLTALDVLNERGDMAYMFKSCCVNASESIVCENRYEYKQVAYDAVINHFALKNDKPTFEQYKDAFGKLFIKEVPIFDISDDEDDYWDYVNDAYENKMQEYFGSSYKKNNKLEEFKIKCFVKENNVTKDVVVALDAKHDNN